MDNETLKAKAAELYESGIGYTKIANELRIDRDKVRRLLGKKSADTGNRFKPSKLHVPLELCLINILANTQMRVSIDKDTVEEYAEAMRDGAEFPAVSVFTNGLTYWLADGFHRYYAAREAALGTITADIYQGALRDAQMFAMGANANHGLRRTNADKRHAVEVALDDVEWGELPNTGIAKMCGVAESFVRKIKQERDVVAQNSHNATPIETYDEPKSKNARERTEAKTPVSSPVEASENPEPSNLPQESGGGEIWKYYFDSANQRLSVILIDNKDCVIKNIVFNSKDDLAKFIGGLQGFLNSWGE
jgi:hypothetical protein